MGKKNKKLKPVKAGPDEISEVHEKTVTERKVKNSTLKPGMGFHRFFKMLKIVMGVFCALTFIQFVIDGNITGLRLADMLINGLFAVLLLASAWLHEKKAGVYLFFTYGILEFAYAMANVLISAHNFGVNQDITNQLVSYPIGSAIMLVPIFIYYKKRMYLLK